MSIIKRITELLTINHGQWFFATILLISISSLAFAYFVEYVLGFEPCILCLYQRIPYFILAVLSIAGLVFKKYKIIVRFNLIVFVTSIILAAYHTGIEREIIGPTETCNAGFAIPEGASADEIRNMLYDAPIASCTRAALKVFGISMTEWNLLLNIVLLVATISIIKRIK